MKKYSKPVIESVTTPTAETVERHPSYGQIGASRVTGGTYLYGSDFRHNNFIAIQISTSELYRGLSNDWPHARKELIEVWLSEAQWATFVSSLNVGMGVQCTIRHNGGEDIDGIERPSNRREQFAAEFQDNFNVVDGELDTLRAKIKDSSLSAKVKAELIGHVDKAQRELGPNTKFVTEQFGEHMEHTIEKAKVEANAYIQHVITRAGLTALNEAQPQPLQIPEAINEPGE